MDSATAHGEAAMFATTPGQAISYQIGDLQIYKFLSDAHRQKGSAFNLRAFHDFLWQNGNVPMALQRWEFLGLNDEMEKQKITRQICFRDLRVFLCAFFAVNDLFVRD